MTTRQKTTNAATILNDNHWRYIVDHVRAVAPISLRSLATWIADQIPGADQQNCDDVAAAALRIGLKRGVFETEKDGGVIYIDLRN